MALTECQKKLIEAVVESNLYLAKKTAVACIAEDTSKKNEYWCRRYKGLLENTPNVLELPHFLRQMATLEDLSDTFLEDRYFLSEREHAVFNHII